LRGRRGRGRGGEEEGKRRGRGGEEEGKKNKRRSARGDGDREEVSAEVGKCAYKMYARMHVVLVAQVEAHTLPRVIICGMTVTLTCAMPTTSGPIELHSICLNAVKIISSPSEFSILPWCCYAIEFIANDRVFQAS